MENGKKLTRFITFLPVVLGFGLTAAYEAAFCGGVKIDGDFVSLWLGASSLSLAVYAFIEKIFPRGEKAAERRRSAGKRSADRTAGRETRPARRGKSGGEKNRFKGEGQWN